VSEKSASIKLTLNKSSFKDGVKDAEKDVKSFGEQARGALNRAFKDGIKGSDEAIKGMFNTIKSGLVAFSGIGGMLGTTELIRAGMTTQGVFKGIAVGMRAGTGEAQNFRDLMEDGTNAATKWGKDVDELGHAMKRVWEETGDKDFTKDSINTIAMVSRASRESVGMIGELSGSLHEKFGITNGELEGTLAAVLSLGNKGGVTVEELSQRIGFIGSVAREAGFNGQAGFQKMLGLLNMADDGGKNLRKNLGAVSQVLLELGNKTERAKLAMKLGMDPSAMKGDATEMIGQIMKATGGKREKLETAFTGEALAFMLDLGKQYSKAFDDAKGDTKTKTKAAVDAYTESLNKASQSQLSATDLNEMAADSMKDGPAKMEAAMQKMRAAFLRPEISDAIGKLADVLPKLVEMLGSVVGFAAEHPIAAGAMAVGGMGAKGMIGGMGSSLLSAGMGGLTQSIASALGAGGAVAGQTAGAGVAAGLAGAAPGAGSALGGSLAAVASPLMANALAIAFAAAAIAALDTYQENDKKSKGHGGEYSMLNVRRNLGKANEWLGMDADSWMGLPGGIGEEDYWKQRAKLTGESNRYSTADDAEAAMKRKEARQVGHEGDEQAMGASFSEEALFSDGGASESPYVLGPLAALAKPTPKAATTHAQPKSAEDMRLLAQMLGGELKVRVMNPEQLREGSAGGGSPRPGYVPKEQ